MNIDYQIQTTHNIINTACDSYMNGQLKQDDYIDLLTNVRNHILAIGNRLNMITIIDKAIFGGIMIGIAIYFWFRLPL